MQESIFSLPYKSKGISVTPPTAAFWGWRDAALADKALEESQPGQYLLRLDAKLAPEGLALMVKLGKGQDVEAFSVCWSPCHEQVHPAADAKAPTRGAWLIWSTGETRKVVAGPHDLHTCIQELLLRNVDMTAPLSPPTGPWAKKTPEHKAALTRLIACFE
jgi:hypothetical protein